MPASAHTALPARSPEGSRERGRLLAWAWCGRLPCLWAGVGVVWAGDGAALGLASLTHAGRGRERRRRGKRNGGGGEMEGYSGGIKESRGGEEKK